MIIFLHGQNTYSSQQKLKEIIEHYKKVHKSGLNLKYFDEKKLDYRDFNDEFQQIPMFNEKKLVILKNIFSNQEFKESFSENYKKFKDSDNIILFYESEVSPKDSFFKFLTKNAQTQEFAQLRGQKLRNWLKKESMNYQVKIEPALIEKLIFFVGSDLWQLSQEIKKLAAFKNGKKIETADIELLVRPNIETDIFQTIDAIALKNKKQALSLMHKHLEKGDSHFYLLSMINFQFRNLLMIKDLVEQQTPYSAISKKTHIHPYVLQKSYRQAEKFTIDELKKIYQKIFQVDLDIKTGKIDSQTALDLLIAEI